MMGMIENKGNILSLPRDGFTLIELLISLTLLVIILGAIYSSFFTVNRAFERFDNVSLKYHEARMGLDIMRREIESALFMTSEQDKKRTGFVIKDRDRFGKTNSEFQFTTFSLKNNLPVRVTYFIDEKDGSLRLLKKVVSVMSPFPETIMKEGSEQADEFSTEIIDGIEGFTVETLFNDKWVKTWDTTLTGRLPDIIRITIELNDNGREVKLTEYARPMMGKRI